MIFILAILAVDKPYLRIANNLNEPRNLGFCLDLRGWRPVSFTNVQLHSCKPNAGTDEQFEPINDAIKGRADANGRCIQAESGQRGASLNAPLCNSSEPLQHFEYVDDTFRLHPNKFEDLCLVASSSMRQAGPYWARDLKIDSCSSTSNLFKVWQLVSDLSDSSFPSPPSFPSPSSPPLIYPVVNSSYHTCLLDENTYKTFDDSVPSDPEFSIIDIVSLLRYVLGKQDMNKMVNIVGCADYNEDGSIDILDIVSFLQYLIEKIYPAEHHRKELLEHSDNENI